MRGRRYKGPVIVDILTALREDVDSLKTENASLKKEFKDLKTTVGKLELEQRKLKQRRHTW